MARLQSEFASSQLQLKQRIAVLEKPTTIVAAGSSFLPAAGVTEGVCAGDVCDVCDVRSAFGSEIATSLWEQNAAVDHYGGGLL